jgi:hypothetical protein
MRYHFTTKPYPHQVRALRKLLRNRGGALQVPMRWGKSKTAVDFAGAMHLLEGVQRVLVICPLSVVPVWEDEIKKHSTDWEILYELGDPRSEFPPLGSDTIQWHIINFEQVYDRHRSEDGTWFPVVNLQLESRRWDLIIVDESHHIGNPQAVVSQYTYRLGRNARFRLIMTGTMFHRKPFFVFGQFKFLDASIFGDSFVSFKKKVAIMGGYGGYEVLRYINLKWMIAKVKPLTFIQKSVPPRDVSVNVIRFDLEGANLAHYVRMEKESITEVGGEEVISPIILSRHLRCQQIAGGWVKTETKYRRVGSDKYRRAKDRMQQYADSDIDKFVVACRFIPELRDAAAAAKAAGYKVILYHGGLSKEQRGVRMRAFADTSQRCAFIAQIAAGKEGINLSAASVMMFYSLPESFVDFDQFRNRIVKFQDERNLMYDYLVAWGTRDQVTYEAMRVKEDVAKYIATRPKLVEEITKHRFLA